MLQSPVNYLQDIYIVQLFTCASMDFGNLRVPSIIPLQIPRDKLYTINTMPPYIAPAAAAAAAAKSLQSCLTLCDPIDGSHQSPPSLGFSRQEYWSRLPFPSPLHACMLSRFSHVRFCAPLWTAAHQPPPTTGFSRQEYWSGLVFPFSGNLPDPGIKSRSCALQADSLPRSQ